MRLIDYLDKGASLGGDAPCLTMNGISQTYAQVQAQTWRIARALGGAGIEPGAHIAILSGNDPAAFAAMLAISRAGAVWCPVNPRNEAAENAFILDRFDCSALIFHSAFAALVEQLLPGLPKLKLVICLDAPQPFARALDDWLLGVDGTAFEVAPVDDLAMIAGTGGTTGEPKGVMLSNYNLETMTALALIGYPFEGRPVYLAMAPLTHAAGVMAFPILTLGGEIVIMDHADPTIFLTLIEQHRVTHSFLPPTVIYMLLDNPTLAATNLSSLQCLWYGAAPMAPARLEEAIGKIGPVMAQIFGQTEAPMLISMMSPRQHLNKDGSVARARLASAGQPSPLVQVAILGADSAVLPNHERGEIVIKSALVMMGYYKNPQATAEASINGWHRTGDIGYLDEDNYLYIVDRAKDMIITGGFNVYSAEVEQALQRHSAVQDCAVFGLPDEKWGERVCAVVQLRPGQAESTEALIAFVKEQVGSVKAPKQIDIWADLPRSRVGKVLKREIRASFLPPAD